MKRRELERKIAKFAMKQGFSWVLVREGANHSVYRLEHITVPIPRHTEIDDGLARKIYKECEPVLGRGWWKP